MKKKASILAVATRNDDSFDVFQILREAGYIVVSAPTRHHAVLGASDSGFDLVIIGDLLCDEEAESLAHDLEIVRAGIPVLMLGSSFPPLPCPPQLVALVNECLRPSLLPA